MKASHRLSSVADRDLHNRPTLYFLIVYVTTMQLSCITPGFIAQIKKTSLIVFQRGFFYTLILLKRQP
jgi:hypothetical protein